jgi:hypothetical protein
VEWIQWSAAQWWHGNGGSLAEVQVQDASRLKGVGGPVSGIWNVFGLGGDILAWHQQLQTS